jgi:hypothetical protein
VLNLRFYLQTIHKTKNTKKNTKIKKKEYIPFKTTTKTIKSLLKVKYKREKKRNEEEEKRNRSREENEPSGGDGGVIYSNFSDEITDEK